MPGPADTFQSYGIGWANASNTPFRLYKHWVHEGGIATPLVVCWPAVIHDAGGIIDEPGHVIDIMATCVEVAGTKYPASFAGFPILPLEGESLLSTFQGKTRRRGPIFWEHEGNRAVRDGKWKLVATASGQWELYDMEADRTEMNDLSKRFPVIVKDLAGNYEEWAKRVHVEPWPVGKETGIRN
jgi:arylsulfatase